MPTNSVQRCVHRFAALAVLAAAPSFPPAAGPAESTGVAVEIRIADAIGPATADYFIRGLREARERGARVLVLRLDTPGGLESAMRNMIRAILASPVPVIVYVAPSGARAASAGTYLLYAAQVAAMAPATNVGAATPVQLFGSEGSGQSSSASSSGDQGSTLARKAVNDSVAYIRSLAELRGRNADWAEQAVAHAVSLTAQQALDQHVIDLIAEDLPQLLERVDGRMVRTAAGEVRLATRGVSVVTLPPGWRTELLAALTNPDVAYLLMLIGIYGLLFEGYNPGAVLPGVAGGISLLLALYAFQILSVNYAGLGLLLLGVILIGAEAFVPAYGTLTVGGILAFVIGSVMLFDREVQGYAIARPLIGAMATLGALIAAGIVTYAVRARRRPVVTGNVALLAETAFAVDGFTERGFVRVHGELWAARTREPVRPGEALRIERIDGLTLDVRRAEGVPPAAPPG